MTSKDIKVARVAKVAKGSEIQISGPKDIKVAKVVKSKLQVLKISKLQGLHGSSKIEISRLEEVKAVRVTNSAKSLSLKRDKVVRIGHVSFSEL